MIRFVMVLIFAGVLTGCGGPAQQYILSETSGVQRSGHHAPSQIGVDRVAVPAYLIGSKIPIQSAKGALSYCDSAAWATEADKGITQHMITYLQKYFATPSVYRYPWDIEHKDGVRTKIIITRLIYVEAKKAVELEANYFVETLRGTGRRARLFHTSVPVRKGETPLIVEAMNTALDRLAAEVARTIARF